MFCQLINVLWKEKVYLGRDREVLPRNKYLARKIYMAII